MQNSGNRIFGYDLIKTIAIFMIVFYHLGGIDVGTIESGKYFFPNFNQLILSFCAASVPLFLMVHGALLLPKRLNLKESIVKVTKMLLLFLFGKIVLQHLVLEKCFSIEDEMVHFWFLATLGIVYFISYFLNQLKWLRYSFLLLLFVYPFLSNLLYDFIIFFKPDLNFKAFGHDGFYTLYALVYYYLGDYLKDKSISFSISFFALFVGLLLINFEVIAMSNHYHIIFDGVNSSFPTIGALFLATGFFILFKDITIEPVFLRKSITIIGSNTMNIYIFHVLFIFLLRYYFHYDSYGISLSSALIISSLLIFVLTYLATVLNSLFRSFT